MSKVNNNIDKRFKDLIGKEGTILKEECTDNSVLFKFNNAELEEMWIDKDWID